MAKEIILVPRIKYEHLLKLIEDNEERVKPDAKDKYKDHTQMTENNQDDIKHSESTSTFSQVGSGYVRRTRTIGKPPGVTVKRLKKHIPWITY